MQAIVLCCFLKNTRSGIKNLSEYYDSNYGFTEIATVPYEFTVPNNVISLSFYGVLCIHLIAPTVSQVKDVIYLPRSSLSGLFYISDSNLKLFFFLCFC